MYSDLYNRQIADGFTADRTPAHHATRAMTSPAGLTLFERTILHRLLDGDHPALQVLRGQLSKVVVTDREATGVGVYVYMKPGGAVARCTPDRFMLSDIVYELDRCAHGGTAALFVENGQLESLELYTWSDPWPEDPQLGEIGYVSLRPQGNLDMQRIEPVPSRDMVLVARQIEGRGYGGGM